MNTNTKAAGNEGKRQPGEESGTFYRWENDALILDILGTAGAKRDAVGKIMDNRIKVSVKAAPEAGKATRCMVRFLAKAFGVSPSAVEVVFGETSRKKRLRIHSPAKLPHWIPQDSGR